MKINYYNEIIRIKNQIKSIESILSNDIFLNKANKSVIDLNKKKLIDFNITLNGIMDIVMRDLNIMFEYNTPEITSPERIEWHIQHLRDCKIGGVEKQEFNDEYFNYVYNKEIKEEEFGELLDNRLNKKNTQYFY